MVRVSRASVSLWLTDRGVPTLAAAFGVPAKPLEGHVDVDIVLGRDGVAAHLAARD